MLGLFVKECVKKSFLSSCNSEHSNRKWLFIANTLYITITTISGIPWEVSIATWFYGDFMNLNLHIILRIVGFRWDSRLSLWPSLYNRLSHLWNRHNTTLVLPILILQWTLYNKPDKWKLIDIYIFLQPHITITAVNKCLFYTSEPLTNCYIINMLRIQDFIHSNRQFLFLT